MNWHNSNQKNELRSIRANGMVGQVFWNGMNYSYRVLTDEQYDRECSHLLANIFARGNGGLVECMSSVEEVIKNV